VVKQKHSNKKLVRDLFIVAISIFIAVEILQLGIINSIVLTTGKLQYLSSFVAGLFFTSAFTLAPASVALAEIAKTTSPYVVALWGGLGAMIGDLIMFLFIRDSLAEDISMLLKHPYYKKITAIFRLRLFRRWVPFLGALVIASPLPDEIGLAMMGLSRVSLPLMLPITFVMNFLGILLVAKIAGAL
jgi:hypothetical protein